MSLRRVIKEVNNLKYHISSHYYDEENCVYRRFMVSNEGMLVIMYELGMSKSDLDTQNTSKSSFLEEKLFDLGIPFITDMISKNQWGTKSGIITRLDQDFESMDWESLQPLDK